MRATSNARKTPDLPSPSETAVIPIAKLPRALRSILWSKTLGLEANTSGKAFLHAQMFGFKLEAYVRHGFSGLSYTVEVMRRRSYTSYDSFYLSENIDAVGLVRRFENAIRRVPAVLKAEEAELAKANADLPRLERQLNTQAFARSDRLQAVKSRIAEIEKALQPHLPKARLRQIPTRRK